MKRLLLSLLGLLAVAGLLRAVTPPAPASLLDMPVFSIAPEEIARVSVELAAQTPARLTIRLTAVKSDAFAQFTAANKGKMVKLMVAGQVLSQPVVSETITSGSLSWPFASPDAAFELAKAWTQAATPDPADKDDAPAKH